jgi:hypothetical protein
LSKKLTNRLSREYYHIVNLYTGILLTTNNPLEYEFPYMSQKNPNLQQSWELLSPVVAIPVGWLEIQNVATGKLLTHNYLTLPPTLTPAPSPGTPRESYNRETWATQWTFAHISCYVPEGSRDIDRSSNVWFIVNRLTGGFLCHDSYHFKNSALNLGAWKPMDYSKVEEMKWVVEHDKERNWRIMNKTSGEIIEQTQTGTRSLQCVNSKKACRDGRASWKFV